ncbi:hypothetical protein Mapa_017381 [Marchantia paleacea]|nr:hypothetical protein Mapa_017381 [Marchantia paleacea]
MKKLYSSWMKYDFERGVSFVNLALLVKGTGIVVWQCSHQLVTLLQFPGVSSEFLAAQTLESFLYPQRLEWIVPWDKVDDGSVQVLLGWAAECRHIHLCMKPGNAVLEGGSGVFDRFSSNRVYDERK